MPTIDPRVDEYINRSALFAQPILQHLRKLVHEACPQVEETIKWSFPHFEYKGILCSMASFKEHCAFTFFKAALMKDAEKLMAKSEHSGMGHFNKIRTLNDLPPDKKLIGYIHEAMRLNDDNKKVQKKPSEKKELIIDKGFQDALNAHPISLEHFNKFSYSCRKEYIEWINEAKTDATRQKRIDTALEWIAEGKGRNWKYEQKTSNKKLQN